MAHKDFNLPDLGEGLTEGEVVSWLVSVGDVIEVDQNVAEIETAKAVVEVPSPFGGTVVTLHGEPGDTLAVGTPLITVDVGGDETPPADTAADAPADDGPQRAEEMPAAPESEEGSGAVLVGYGTGGGGSRRPRTAGNGAGTRPAARPSRQKVQREGRPLAKPPVRKLAKDLGVDLDYVAGSGEGGVITRADVEAAAETTAAQPDSGVGVLITDDEGNRLGSAPPNEPAPAETPEPVAIPAPPTGELEPERIALNRMRKTISAQMSRSRREIPEAVTWVDIDATPLWDYRQRLNAAQSEVKVSPLAIIMRACVAGLRRYPTINASLDTAAEEIVLHRHVNLGFAAQTDRGLVVPVIAGAHRMSTLEIASSLNGLAATAREGKLTPAQMSGGTFTVSNYGAFGVDGGDMVINHPESAILGVGRIVDKPWVVDGELAVRKVMTLSVAFDHRISDGGEGGGFLRYVADLLENPTLLTAAL